MVVSAVGLAIFNLFMVVPAAGVRLAAGSAVRLPPSRFYLGGVAITASGLAGANELVLDGPLRHFVIRRHGRDDAADQGHDRRHRHPT